MRSFRCSKPLQVGRQALHYDVVLKGRKDHGTGWEPHKTSVEIHEQQQFTKTWEPWQSMEGRGETVIISETEQRFSNSSGV